MKGSDGMSDQCQNCILCGSYSECIKTDCSAHENWINKKQQQIIIGLSKTIRDLYTHNELAVSIDDASLSWVCSCMERRII